MDDIYSLFYDSLLWDPRMVTRLSVGVAAEGMGVEGLQRCWGLVDDEIYFLAMMKDIPNNEIGKALIFAHYLTFIPYGEKGYAAFDVIARELGFGGAAQWRKLRLRQILPDPSKHEEALKKVDEFFDAYLLEEVKTHDIFDLTRALVRLRGQFQYAERYDNMLEQAEEDSTDGLLDFIDNYDVVNIADVLALGPITRPLGEKERDTLKKLALEANEE